MSLLKEKDGVLYEAFPLQLQKVQLGNAVIYDRDKRGMDWTLIDLETSTPVLFIPKGASAFTTKDGKTLHSKSLR